MKHEARFTREERRKWGWCIRDLRDECPCMYPVRVRRAPVSKNDNANVRLLGRGRARYFDIRISPGACFQLAVQCLVHEWAHCLAWSESHPSLTDHDEITGIAWSRTYRTLFPD